MRSLLRTSAMTNFFSTLGAWERSSSCMLCIGVSAKSTSISLRIGMLTSWRQSSPPIEPAPPVTTTTLSVRNSRISRMLILISSRPRRSSILISLILLRKMLSSKVASEGRTRIWMRRSEQNLTRLSCSLRAATLLGNTMAEIMRDVTRRAKSRLLSIW